MSTFQFTIDGQVFKFTAKENNMNIRDVLEKNYPKCTFHLDYCVCIDACKCKNGHFVSTTKWVCDDISKPWLGRNVDYTVPLQVVRNGVAYDYSDEANGTRYR
jgi:hypothetical protein